MKCIHQDTINHALYWRKTITPKERWELKKEEPKRRTMMLRNQKTYRAIITSSCDSQNWSMKMRFTFAITLIQVRNEDDEEEYSFLLFLFKLPSCCTVDIYFDR